MDPEEEALDGWWETPVTFLDDCTRSNSTDFLLHWTQISLSIHTVAAHWVSSRGPKHKKSISQRLMLRMHNALVVWYLCRRESRGDKCEKWFVFTFQNVPAILQAAHTGLSCTQGCFRTWLECEKHDMDPYPTIFSLQIVQMAVAINAVRRALGAGEMELDVLLGFSFWKIWHRSFSFLLDEIYSVSLTRLPHGTHLQLCI